ncbi:MAG: hypothetical protein HZC48_05085 [Nitrospirae bacterium]|nr:hypothetical protein [Nitrospirota bacterium]
MKGAKKVIIRNEDIKSLTAEIPEGHKHLRTTIVLNDGMEITFQEAAVANLVRAYVTVKTHPAISRVKMKNKRLVSRKKGYSEWQLVEQKAQAVR